MMSAKFLKPASILDCAIRLSDLGYHPVPIPAGCKGPTIPGWQNLRITFDNADQYFTEPGMLIGILHKNTLAFDVDVYDEDLATQIVNEGMRRFPGALERIGQYPKSALFLRMEGAGFKVQNTSKHEKSGLSAQVEVRSLSRQIVVYGKHPDTQQPYRWPRGELWATPWLDLPLAQKDDVERFRDWCDDIIRKWAGVADPKIIDIGNYSPKVSTDEKPSEKAFLQALRHIPASVNYDDWVSALMGIHDYFGGSQRGLDVANDWSSAYPDYTQQEVAQKWRSFEPGKGKTYKTVMHLAKVNGADLSAIARLDVAPIQVHTAQSVQPNEPENDDDWHARLVVNSKGRAIFNMANTLLMLENNSELKGCFAYDEFRQVKLVTKPLPGSNAPKAQFKGRDFRDTDVSQVVAFFNRNGFPDATKTTIADAIDAISEASTFHPVRNYLEALPQWDGVERIDGWLQDYCNVEPKDATEAVYVREVASKWLVSAVARAMRPGCKADGVLILEGSQGARKSSTLRILAGEDWFGDSLPPMSSKDASDYLRGKWIIEMAELSNINKAEVEVVKAFISRESERFRPAYARSEITYLRQCVFAGSTNKSDYLRDETGNRRFWPVKVNGLCDTEGLKADRDQIWAEALHRYRSGAEWWLSGEGESAAKSQQDQRVSQDAWEGDIVAFCTGRIEVSPAEVGIHGLKIELPRLDRASTNRITSVLASMGYVRRGKFTSGENKGRARFVLEDGE
jgi:predicted P-loop ATPase